MPRALQTAALSFGLVSIPVRLYTAATTKSVHFHMLHQKDGSRIHQQLVCNAEEKVVSRKEIVKGYELRKGKYVQITEEELDALEAEANRNVEILEFVPAAAVDPVFIDKTYYLGPEKGGEKPYRLLADAMQDHRRDAIAQLVMRGKEHLVMIRPSEDRHLLLHILYYADEVRDIRDIDVPKTKASERERKLAGNLLDQLSTDTWNPNKYKDTYRQRVLDLIHRKEKGKGVMEAGTEKHAPVVDLMAALKRSLETKPKRKSLVRDKARKTPQRRTA